MVIAVLFLALLFFAKPAMEGGQNPSSILDLPGQIAQQLFGSNPAQSLLCGNGSCEQGETIQNCSSDCTSNSGSASNGSGGSGSGGGGGAGGGGDGAGGGGAGGGGGGGGGGSSGGSGSSSPPAVCGDSNCEASESCGTCAIDCGDCPSTACTSQGGTCFEGNCPPEFRPFPSGNPECLPGNICCVPIQPGFFFDDFNNTDFVDLGTIDNVVQEASEMHLVVQELGGSFSSIPIPMNGSSSRLTGTWNDLDPNLFSVSLSSDNGTNWCAIARGQTITQNDCSQLPAQSFIYRANFYANMHLDFIRFEWLPDLPP